MLACALVCVITAVVDIRLLQAILLIRGCRQVVVQGMVLLRNRTRSAVCRPSWFLTQAVWFCSGEKGHQIVMGISAQWMLVLSRAHGSDLRRSQRVRNRQCASDVINV